MEICLNWNWTPLKYHSHQMTLRSELKKTTYKTPCFNLVRRQINEKSRREREGEREAERPEREREVGREREKEKNRLQRNILVIHKHLSLLGIKVFISLRNCK